MIAKSKDGRYCMWNESDYFHSLSINYTDSLLRDKPY